MTHICVIIKANNENSCVLQVPIELQTAEFIKSLAIAIDLPFRTREGRFIDYTLRFEKNRQYLSREKNLLDNGVFHGDVLIITPIDSPIGHKSRTDRPVPPTNTPQPPTPVAVAEVNTSGSGSYNTMGQPWRSDTDGSYGEIRPLTANNPNTIHVIAQNYPSNNVIQRTPQGSAELDYVLQRADSLYESRQIEAALKLLLQVWWADYQLGKLPSEATDPPLFSRLEAFSYTFLGTALSGSQALAEQVFSFLQDREPLTFFTAYPGLTERIVQAMLDLHRDFVAREDFSNAQLASLLAVALNRQHKQAIELQAQVSDYIRWHNSRDPKERVRLATNIYNYDPNYGNIGRDLMRSEDEALAARQTRGSFTIK